MTSKIALSSSLLALLLAGCSHGNSSGGTPLVGAQVPTAGAARSQGDLMPTNLVLMPLPKPMPGPVLGGSDALSPHDTFSADAAPTVFSTRTLQRIVTGSDHAAYTFPIDNPLGARVIVRPLDPKVVITSLHMHSVATGLQLDHGRDSQNTMLGSKAGMPTADPATQAYAPLVNARTLSVDEPMKPGLVQLDIPPELQAVGVVIEVQQPNTLISLTGQADELAYAYGDAATLTFSLANDATPIDGATVTASMELADHSRTTEITLTPAGGGKYTATVPLSFSDAKYVGAWGIHMRATGSFGGVPFERTVEAGLGYWPAHARMTTVGTPVIHRGGDGLIDDVSVDVGIETLADDQLTVRGVLTTTAADGLEHLVATAQTGQVVTHEGGTITLHFGSESLVFANIGGPLHLRDLALVSQGNSITQHRIGRALDLNTPAFAREELRVPPQIPLHVQELIANGDLEGPGEQVRSGRDEARDPGPAPGSSGGGGLRRTHGGRGRGRCRRAHRFGERRTRPTRPSSHSCSPAPGRCAAASWSRPRWC